MFFKMYFWTIEMSWIRGQISGQIRGESKAQSAATFTVVEQH